MTWKLQAITDEISGQEITIDRDMLVGRHQDADIVLQSAEISRRHAAFLLKENALWVQDLKSSNGTYVNDIRIDQEKLLKDEDIVQFASLKFTVLAPTQASLAEAHQDVVEVEPVATKIEEVVIEVPQAIIQPSEAVATSEFIAPTPILEKTEDSKVVDEVVRDTPAQEMSHQGMPSLAERAEASVSPEGMPERIVVPKPAPIPEGVNIHVAPTPTPVKIPETPSVVQQQVEEKKNASLGLITIVILIILAVIAWLFFK
ncbi:FHA domain-containing protein [Acinetobacter sp. ANC 3832]|uniref:FHA domain-containing protein n=1 Tax=Acinetobacter sp. ANC 3832 TaxID=1977874 RepID=UPI000A35AA1E|nr:FHA domain-containing protein [Acinetobacter sp. ANC 3832]OTG91669.1 FHA domain-containing protein [Acinetobacter sp. ANC 3832]